MKLYKHIREKGTGRLVATLAATLVNGEPFVAWAICRKTDKPCKATGRLEADISLRLLKYGYHAPPTVNRRIYYKNMEEKSDVMEIIRYHARVLELRLKYPKVWLNIPRFDHQFTFISRDSRQVWLNFDELDDEFIVGRNLFPLCLLHHLD